MSSTALHQTSKGKPTKEESTPIYFYEDQSGNTSCTMGEKIVLPSNVMVTQNTHDAKGKKLKKSWESFNVKGKDGAIRSFSSLDRALKFSGFKMVPCPQVEGWMVPEGDVFRLQAHLRHHSSDTFAALLKESGMPKFFKKLYVYPDGYSLEPRFISPHCAGRSFGTKKDLDDALKRANPRPTSEFFREKTCPHGQDCRGKNGACPFNHGMPICKWEKNENQRCGNPFCKFDHYAGKAEHTICKRIAHEEGKLTSGKLEKVSDESPDLNTPGAFDSLKFDSSGESDNEDDESAIKVAESVLVDDDNESVSSVSSASASVSTKSSVSVSDDVGFTKARGRKSKSQEKKVQVLRDQLETLRKEKASRKKKKPSEKSSPKAIKTPPLPGASGDAIPLPNWKAKCAKSRADDAEKARIAKEKQEEEDRLAKEEEEKIRLAKEKEELLLEKARIAAAKQTEAEILAGGKAMEVIEEEHEPEKPLSREEKRQLKKAKKAQEKARNTQLLADLDLFSLD
jgi:hypothetical protein